MTQASSAQPIRTEVAWQVARKGRSLARRRADLEARMRSMALADLQQVKARFKELHEEYERLHGKLKQEDLARKLNKTPTRTLQSWINGEVETDRANYERLARFYSRGLGRKITANWILFGQDQAPKPSPATNSRPSVLSADDSERLRRVEEMLEEVLRRTAPSEPAPSKPDTAPSPEEELGDERPPQTPERDEGDIPGEETG